MQTVETLNEGLKRGFRITIPAQEIDAKIDAELKTIAPQVRMPGFRPGKVPANLVRKMHGPRLQQQALETAVQEGVQQLLTDQNIRPAMQPSVRLEEGQQPGGDVTVEVEVETLPDVPPAQIEGLKLERLQVEPTDEMIDAAVARMAEGQKSFDSAPADHAARQGDAVLIDFEGKVDGTPFEGGKGDGMSVEIGSGRLIPGFEDQLVGAKANEQRVVEVTFPEEYPVDYLKGRAATFDVTVNEVQTPKEAQADDSFAKSMGLESIEQLRGLLKGQVEQELNGLTRTHMKRQLLDQLAAAHDFPVPQTMVEAEFEQIWKQLEHEASHEADPDAARTEMETERAIIAPSPSAACALACSVRPRAAQRRRGQQPGDEPADHAGRASNTGRGSPALHGLCPPGADGRRPAACAALRGQGGRLYLLQGEITDRAVTREELEASIEADEMATSTGPGCGPRPPPRHDHARGNAPPRRRRREGGALDQADGAAQPRSGQEGQAGRSLRSTAAASGEGGRPPRSPARKDRRRADKNPLVLTNPLILACRRTVLLLYTVSKVRAGLSTAQAERVEGDGGRGIEVRAAGDERGSFGPPHRRAAALLQ
jgi:trigger factor